MKPITGLVSAMVVAITLVGCGGFGDDQAAKPSFTLPNVISAVPPQ
jgi:hypothetical protein